MRLIDADALVKDIEAYNRPLCDDYHMKDYVLDQIITDIRNAPTIEAVPVVRCRECKYYEVGQNKVDAWSACYAHIGRIIETWDDNFCGWGERKEE